MPTDWQDHEERAVPFNDVLVQETGVNTAGGHTAPGLSGYAVAAYRSTAVTVNPGAADCAVEVGWTIDGGSGAVAVETKTVTASKPATLFFVNQGHLLDHVKLTGGAGVSYSVTESNQLPLPPSATGGGAPDTLLLQGVGMAIPAVFGGFSGESTWNHTNTQSQGAAIWSYNLDGSGNIVEVVSSAPGVYDVGCNAVFQAPSAYTQMSLFLNSFGTIPLAMVTSPLVTIGTADVFNAYVGLLCWFTTGTAQFSAQLEFDRNTSGFVIPNYWYFKRWAL